MTKDKEIFDELLLSCRSGDLDTVDALLNTPHLNINQTDDWDYSPLILASLCGHYQIVKLLLSRGAVCDRDTFEGERCIYGALNDDIRDLLLSFDISKKIDVSQPFASHLSSMLNPVNACNVKDIVFIFKTLNEKYRDLKYFKLNKFLLAARSKYCLDKLNDEWRGNEIELVGDPVIFKKIIDYIYLKPDKLVYDEELMKMAKLWDLGLYKSLEQLKSINKSEEGKFNHDNSIKYIEIARNDMSKFVNVIIDNKISIPINDLSIGQDEVEFDDIEPSIFLKDLQNLQLLNSDAFPDIILSVIDVPTNAIIYYPCHRAMLMRSEYFHTMFNSEIFIANANIPTLNKEFGEIISLDRLSVIKLNCANSEVAELILTFIYHDDINYLPLNLTIDLLFIADELLLEKLKTLCAINLTSKFKQFNWEEFEAMKDKLGYDCYDLIRISWQTRCEKLEQYVTKLIAYNLEQIYKSSQNNAQLQSLIMESASRIQERQSTDTIELIDDIRYYLSKKYGVSGESSQDFIDLGFLEKNKGLEDSKVMKNAMIKYESDIEMIDSLLDRVDLDA